MVTGRGASEVVAAEGAASAGEIVVSPATCAVLPSRYLGPWRGEGRLLRSLPGGPSGQPVFPDVPAGIELARFVPVEIRSHLMAGGVEPEHRTATVAFCHFDGTDDLLEQHGPGELGRRLDVVVRRIQEAAADHGVTFLGSDVDRDGGKVILVSGVPRHRGNDEERMLLTLRRIADQDLPLPLRIGVNRGPVFSGDVGTRYRRTFTVMGDTVNLAARVMAKAQGGQVLATSSVLDHSRRPFETEALEPFTVKGKRRPVVAHVVGPPRSLRLRSDLLPLTGRHDELRSLVADLDRAADGAGRVVFLVGEEGSGKSRLVDELSRAAGPQRSTIVVCEEYEHSSPYSASARVGRALLGLEPQCDPHSLGERLTAAVGRQVPELLPHLPLIGTGLGLAIADTPDTAALEPQFRRAAVERWTARLFLALRPPPHLLVVEDVHHMDDASQGVIRQLVYDQGSSPGVLCLTSRLSSEGLAVPVADHVRTITLRPLTVDEAVRALVEASRHDPMLPHDVRFLAERCMGNPSFLEELWRARRAGLPLEVLPDSVDDAVAADIDRLPPPHRHLLRCASVLGTTFCQEDLDAVVAGDDNERSAGPRPDSLDEFLDSSDSGAIRFRSPLVRECAYEGLAFRLRRQLHGRAADAMVARLGEHATDQAALLSLHCLHAQRYRDAWNFGRAAAAEAAARYANVDAARLYERALTAAHRLSEIPDSARASAWEACGDVLDRAGDYTQAARAYRRARSLLGQDTLSQAQLCLKEAWMPERVGRFADAVRWIQRGLRLLADVDDVGAGRLRAQLQALLGGIRQAQGRSHEAVRCCENALAEARSSGERKAEAQALYLLDWAWATLGRLDLAVHSPRALEIYRQLGDLGGEAVTLNN
ncbi:MAG TPA: AAA family ATPase, partial [Acidimicrobiales bacterium]|nr:AAA family ATPase [Acidimicrobiales bacterium]